MFRKKYIIQSIDIDEFGLLKLSALFKYIQLVAGDAIEDSGIGQKVLLQKGLLWVLTRVGIQINKWPKWQDEICISTYPNDNKKFIYPRHFVISDKEGNVLIKIVSTWAIIDSFTRRLSIFDLSQFNDFITESHDDELPLPEKLFIKDDIIPVYSHTVRYTDCDTNKHLNNTRYIDLILDVNSSSFYKENIVTYFQIQYEFECREFDEIHLYKNNNYVVGKVGDKTSFVAYIEYKDRKNG